ncbi:MAG TPA: class I SAM-dependent methyltransferase [Hyphomonas sp.]|nr:class I SAM-dependent methyltransferase [Hyphomonas sp.]HRK67825.1 class I SAM-dependent methyltransferase [Hyphomonas sp.]
MRDAAGRILGLYDRHAAAWDALRNEGNFPERYWVERFAGRLPSGARVLDLGCGSGRPVAEYLVGRGFRLTGIDGAPALIDLCRERFPDHHWQVGDMRRLDLGETFDGLIAWYSLFHLPPDDQGRMFSVLAAHAEPGTVLAFTSGDTADESIGSFEGEPLYHASLAPEEYRTLLESAGFRLIDGALNDAARGGLSVWIAVKE